MKLAVSDGDRAFREELLAFLAEHCPPEARATRDMIGSDEVDEHGVMVLPQWLKSRSQPLWVGDVIAALAHALASDGTASAWYDLPGPEVISAREMLEG